MPPQMRTVFHMEYWHHNVSYTYVQLLVEESSAGNKRNRPNSKVIIGIRRVGFSTRLAKQYIEMVGHVYECD